MIEIKIHRGTHQIGGCATEIECDGERILIDLGANLPGMDKKAAISDEQLLDKVFGEKRERPFKMILFSHYHGDHYGLYKEVPEGISMYIGPTAKKILEIVTEYIDRNAEEKGKNIIKRMKEYSRGKSIEGLEKMKVTPFSVDHSALDAYMFLIEAEGKKILFTGDFRTHGILNERDQFWRVLKKYVGDHVDVLLTEGTMLSRIEEANSNIVKTEKDLGREAKKYFEEKKYNFVMVSSTNLDSIMEFYHNTPDDKLFIVDKYQARVMLEAMENMGKQSEMYRAKTQSDGLNKKIYVMGEPHKDFIREMNSHGSKLKKKLYFKSIDKSPEEKDNGFVMLVRPNRYSKNGESKFEKEFREYRTKYPDEVNFIYSMWGGYLKGGKAEDQDIVRFIGDANIIQIHTSGHADVGTIQRLIKKVDPDKIIPMHTEMADEFGDMEQFAAYKDRVYVLSDEEESRYALR